MKPSIWHERTLACSVAAAVAADDEAIQVFAGGSWDEGLAMLGAATGVGVMKRHDVGTGLMIAAGSVAGWGIINSIA